MIKKIKDKINKQDADVEDSGLLKERQHKKGNEYSFCPVIQKEIDGQLFDEMEADDGLKIYTNKTKKEIWISCKRRRKNEDFIERKIT